MACVACHRRGLAVALEFAPKSAVIAHCMYSEVCGSRVFGTLGDRTVNKLRA